MFGGILDNDTTIIDIKKKCENCYYFYINGLFVCHKCVECKEQSNYKYYLGKEYNYQKPILVDDSYKNVKGMNHKRVYIIGNNEGLIFEKDEDF